MMGRLLFYSSTAPPLRCFPCLSIFPLLTSSDQELDATKPAEVVEPSDAAPTEQRWKAGRVDWMIIPVLAFLSVVVSIDATILATALPTLARALGGDAVSTFWTGTSYLLTKEVF